MKKTKASLNWVIGVLVVFLASWVTYEIAPSATTLALASALAVVTGIVLVLVGAKYDK